MSKGKANYINKVLCNDWVTLQAKTKGNYEAYKQEFDNRKHEMDSHDIAEYNGYMMAMRETMDLMCRLMNEWPDFDAHRAYRNVEGNNELG